MREIIWTSAFKKDYKREAKGKHRKTLDGDLETLVDLLANDHPLPERNKDHALAGDWADHRDCHVKPDLVLIYQKSGGVNGELWMARLGSHAELDL
jgi:mRNA interferase YafQ